MPFRAAARRISSTVPEEGTFWCIQAFAGMRCKRGGPGCIVNIGDLNGLTSYVTGQILAVDGGMTAW